MSDVRVPPGPRRWRVARAASSAASPARRRVGPRDRVHRVGGGRRRRPSPPTAARCRSTTGARRGRRRAGLGDPDALPRDRPHRPARGRDGPGRRRPRSRCAFAAPDADPSRGKGRDIRGSYDHRPSPLWYTADRCDLWPLTSRSPESPAHPDHVKGRVLAASDTVLRRPRTSPSSKASSRSGSGRACTSAPPARAVCTTSSGRSSTTRSTRPWPATATRIDVTLLADGGCRGRRRRPGHPGRRPPGPHKIKTGVEIVLTKLHAGGKFGGRRLQGVGRPARRRRVGGERAVAAPGRRGRPRRQAPPHGVRATAASPRASWRSSATRRVAAPAPRSRSGPTPPSSRRPSSAPRRCSSASR